MRFMIIVRATPETEAEPRPTDRPSTSKVVAEMGAYHEELQRAGVLLDGNGLKPSAKGGASATPATSGPSSTAPSPR